MQVAKWGNSLAVRLPKSLVDKLNLKPGDEISLTSADDRRLEVTKTVHKDAALARMRVRNFQMPADYSFDRDEANAR